MRLRVDDSETAKEFKEYLTEESPEYKLNYTENGVEYDDSQYSVLISPKFQTIIPKKAKYDNPLIFGKNSLEQIISLEVKDDKVWLFLNNGEVLEKPMIYWILSEKKLDAQFDRLEGNQHYKYIRRFVSYKAFKKCTLKYKKKDTFQIWNEKESAMIYYGYTMFKGLKVSDVSVLSCDIEAAGLERNDESEVYLITNTFRDSKGVITKKHFRVDNYSSDVEMIGEWCKWVVSIDPTILTGHNFFGYDLPYLNHCYGEPLPIGKYGETIEINKKPSHYRVDGTQTWDYHKIHIYGRHIIDGMFLAVKYDIGRKYLSWGLKQIAEQEGFVNPDRQFYDASKIRENWGDPIEREKIVAYGIDDSDDSLSIYDLMIPSIFYMSQSIPKPFQLIGLSASGAQLNSIMVRAYMQEGHSLPKASEKDYVSGGMSYGVPGIYDNVVKWDAKSFYPNTILTFEIYDKMKDPKGYFLEMVRYFTHKRFEQKDQYKATNDKYYDDLQASSKVFINSSYGMLATPGLNFNSFGKAALITKCCRAALQKAVLWATDKPIDYWWSEYKESTTSEQDFRTCEFIDSKARVKSHAMPRHNWKLVNIDTDALSFCKEDESVFTKDEHDSIYKELNSIMYSEWEDDGTFDKIIVLKSKNYIMVNDGEIKKKGSSITDKKREPALLEMMDCIIHDLIDTKGKNIKSIYKQCALRSNCIVDINKWANKKSVSKAVLNPSRTNERKILDAILHKNPREGDKYWMYTAIDGEIQKVAKGELEFYTDGRPKMKPNKILKLVEDWNGDEDKSHYTERVYKTLKIFENLLDMNEYTNYSLKSNRKFITQLGTNNEV
jgi:DNA polymerase elongation subunit (family B)